MPPAAKSLPVTNTRPVKSAGFPALVRQPGTSMPTQRLVAGSAHVDAIYADYDRQVLVATKGSFVCEYPFGGCLDWELA